MNKHVYTDEKIDVFDLVGKLIYIKKFEKNQFFDVDLLSLGKGIYNMTIGFNRYKVNNKIVLKLFQMKENILISRALLLFISLVLLTTNVVSQTVEWAKSLGANYDEQGTIISKPVLDAQNNLYITGAFKGEVDFNPGPEEFILSSSGSDIFVAKYNSDGDFEWANSLNYGEDDMGGGIAVNGKGDVFIHNYDGEIIKFNTDGQLIWKKQIPGLYFSYYNIDFDKNGDLIITGGFFETIDSDPGSENYNIDPVGLTDLLILKLDDAGNFIWAKSVGGSGAYIDGLGHLADNYIYINGYFSGTIDFDTGEGTYNLTASKEYYSLQLDLEGNFINVISLMEAENSMFDGIYSSCIDTEGNIYSVGAFTGTFDFDPGEEINLFTSSGDLDGFIQKVSPNGELLWIKPINSTYSQYVWFVDIDSKNNTYVTGVGPFSDSTLLTETGDSSGLFIIKVSPTGTFDWVKTTGYSYGASVVDDKTGDIYTAGWFNTTVHINNDNVDSVDAIGSSDIFIQKMIQQLDTSVQTINSPPQLSMSLPDLSIFENFVNTTIAINQIFIDPDDDSLIYQAQSVNENVVTVSVNGDSLTLNEIRTGNSKIILKAIDPLGLFASDTFIFTIKKPVDTTTINSAPWIKIPIQDIEIDEGFGKFSLPFVHVFTDDDGDSLIYSVKSGNEGAVTTTFAEDSLVLNEVGTGNSEIILTATDLKGLSVSDTFIFTVNIVVDSINPNSPPMIIAPLYDIELDEGFGIFSLPFMQVFEDSDQDTLYYSVMSNNKNVVNVSINLDSLIFMEKGIGIAEISLIADDNLGEATVDKFIFEVSEVGNKTNIVRNNPEKSKIIIFPNPSTVFFTIEINNPVTSEVKIDVFNLVGELVYSKIFKKQQPITIDLSSYSQGMYNISIMFGAYQMNKKIILK